MSLMKVSLEVDGGKGWKFMMKSRLNVRRKCGEIDVIDTREAKKIEKKILS